MPIIVVMFLLGPGFLNASPLEKQDLINVQKLTAEDQSLLDQALSAHQEGELNIAIEKYQILVEQNPKNAQLVKELGVLFFELKNYEEALKLFHRSNELEPTAETEFYLAQAYLGLAELPFAAAHFKKAIERDPNHLGAYYGLGLVLDAQNDETAEGIFRTVVAKDPSVVDAYFHLGSIYYARRKFPQAEESFQQVLAFQPDNGAAYYNLGLARLHQGKWESAREALRNAIANHADEAESLFQIAFSYEAQRFFDDAVSGYREVLKLNPTDLDAKERLEALQAGHSLTFGSTQSKVNLEQLMNQQERFGFQSLLHQNVGAGLTNNAGAFNDPTAMDARATPYMIQSAVVVLERLFRNIQEARRYE